MSGVDGAAAAAAVIGVAVSADVETERGLTAALLGQTTLWSDR